jgi:hypothetical protein
MDKPAVTPEEVFDGEATCAVKGDARDSAIIHTLPQGMTCRGAVAKALFSISIDVVIVF